MFNSTNICSALIVLTFLTTVSLAQAQNSPCDFSVSRPVIFDHALYNAAVRQVKPTYPPAAKAVKASGNINVRILVDRTGRVVKSCALGGHPLLRTAAEKAALKWRFKRNFGLSIRQRRNYIQSTVVFVFNLDK